MVLGEEDAMDGGLDARLTRLLGRRVALSSEEEGEEGFQPAQPSAAAAALKQLLQHAPGELTSLQQDLGVPMGCWLSTPARAAAAGGAGIAPSQPGGDLGGGQAAGRVAVRSVYEVQQEWAQQAGGAAQQQQLLQHVVQGEEQHPLEQQEQALREQAARQREEGVAEELRQQAEEEARREKAREQREWALLQIQLAYRQQRLAAGRIARAWQMYSHGPARAQRVEAATRVQSAWRALKARQAAVQRRQRRDLLGQLHTAVDAGNWSGVQEATAALAQLGFASDAQQLVAEFDGAAEKAVCQLRAAAAAGSQQEFQRTLMATQKYSHLQQAGAEAAGTFAERVVAAEGALRAAAQGRPMLEFREAAALAASLGVEAGTLQEAEQSIVARNQQAMAQLLAAVEASPFDADALQAACQHADALGLHAEVARTQRALQLRKHRAEQQLKVLAEGGGGGEVEAAAADARLLGLLSTAEAALLRLGQRRVHAERELWRAAEKGAIEEYESAAEKAAMLGAAAAVQESCGQAFSRRRQVAEEELARDAVEGSVAAFRRSRAAALRLGLGREVVGAAEEQMQRRRREVAGELEAAAREACGLALHLDSCCEGRGGMGAMEGAGGACPMAGAGCRGGAATVLAAHLGIACQLCTALVARAGVGTLAAGWASGGGGGGLLSPGGSSRGSADGGAAVEEALALAEHLCRFVLSAVHQHVCSRGGGGRRRSLRDVLLRFAAAAAEAGRRELGRPVAEACAAVVVQFEALLSRHTVEAVRLQAQHAGHGQPPLPPRQQEERLLHGGGNQEGADIILRQVQRWALPGGVSIARLEGTCRSHEALVQGFEAWRRRQQERLSHAELEALAQSWQPQEPGPTAAAASAAAAATAAAWAELEKRGGPGATAGEDGGGASQTNSRLWRMQLQNAVQLEVNRQGLTSLELLVGSTSLRSLELSTNYLASLQGLSALAGLRDLVVSDNQLASLGAEGQLRGLSLLTRLVADDNPLEQGVASTLAGLADLPSLAALSLRNCQLDVVAGLRLCASLTSLSLAGNRLADASPLRSLSRLVHLDVGSNRLASLEGLALGCPLLRSLVASGNPLGAFPADLSLPFLRELWLNGCGLAAVGAAWPWLPSLRELHLQDNALSSLPAMHGFPSLTSLDLSFNSFASGSGSGGSVLASLTVLSTLRSLRLNDNPLAAAGRAYAAAVLETLPWLEELDLGEIRPEQRLAQLARVRRQGRLRLSPEEPLRQGSCALWGAASAGLQEGGRCRGGGCCAARWGAEAVLWALAQPVIAAAVFQQQGPLARAAFAARTQTTQPGCSLEGLEVLAGLPGGAAVSPTNAGEGHGHHPQTLAGRLLQQYAFMVTSDPKGQLQGLLGASPSYYAHTLAALARHATAIQVRWRGFAVRRHARVLAQERHARRAHAAAARIQAVWRGRVSRRRYADVAEHLVAWRAEWRRRQALLEAHRRHCAAVRVQAAWRGHQVRRLVRQARAAAVRLRPLGASPSQEAASEDLPSCDSFLAGIFQGGGAEGQSPMDLLGVGAPERLALQLAAATGSGSSKDWELPAGPGGSVPMSLPALSKLPLAVSAGAAAVPLQLRPQKRGGAQPGMLAARNPPADRLSAAAVVLAPMVPAAGRREEPVCLPPLQLASPTAVQLAGSSERRAVEEPNTAGSHHGGVEEEANREWSFKDEATAAAFMQLRRKQAQQAKKRQVRKQMEDPEARLKAFHRTSYMPEGVLQLRAGSLHLHSAPPAAGRQAGQQCIPGDSASNAGSSSRCSLRHPRSAGPPTAPPQPRPQSPVASQHGNVAKGMGQCSSRESSSVQRRPVLLRTLFPFEF